MKCGDIILFWITHPTRCLGALSKRDEPKIPIQTQTLKIEPNHNTFLSPNINLTRLRPSAGRKIIDNGQFRPWAVGSPFRSTLVGISFQCNSLGIIFLNISVGISFQKTWLGISVPSNIIGNINEYVPKKACICELCEMYNFSTCTVLNFQIMTNTEEKELLLDILPVYLLWNTSGEI